jgi:hypothetical protein
MVEPFNPRRFPTVQLLAQDTGMAAGDLHALCGWVDVESGDGGSLTAERFAFLEQLIHTCRLAAPPEGRELLQSIPFDRDRLGLAARRPRGDDSPRELWALSWRDAGVNDGGRVLAGLAEEMGLALIHDHFLHHVRKAGNIATHDDAEGYYAVALPYTAYVLSAALEEMAEKDLLEPPGASVPAGQRGAPP